MFEKKFAFLRSKYLNVSSCFFQDIHFGEKFSRDFVDSKEDDDSEEALMNLHNNEAGRRVSNEKYFNLGIALNAPSHHFS